MSRGKNVTRTDDDLARLERLVRRTDRRVGVARARADRLCRRLADGNGSATRDPEGDWRRD